MDNSSKTDKELVEDYLHEKLKRSEAERVLILRYLDIYYKRAYYILKSYFSSDDLIAGHAENIAQMAVVELLKTIERFDFKMALRPWATSICINITRNYLRDNKLSVIKQISFDFVANDPSLKAPDLLSSFDERDQVERALSKLSDFHRRLIVWIYFDGYSYQDIANITGKTPESVRSAYRRAMTALKIILLKEAAS